MTDFFDITECCDIIVDEIITDISITNATVIVNGGLLPTGGTTGQLAAKKSNDNYDVEWINPPSGAVWGSIFGTLSNQTDLQNAFNLKANTSSLAAVAFSGAYSDLTGKPTIPTATSQLTNDSGFITAATAPVTSVSGKTGAVTLVKADVGLGNVDNTSDANKPVSTATQTALNGKQSTIATGATAQYLRGDLSLATFPTNVSSFTNDAGYLTSSALSPYVQSTRSISTTPPLSGGGNLSANRTISIAQATALADGYLSSTDWSAFNAKQPAGSYLNGTLTSTRVPFASGSNALTDDANFVFDSSIDKLSLTSAETVTVANVGSVTFTFTGVPTFTGDGSNCFVTVYAYKTRGIYTVYSPAGTASIPQNDGFADYGVALSCAAVTGADGYKWVVNLGANNGILYGTSTTTSCTVFGANWTTSTSTVTPSSPSDVKRDVLVLSGILPLANVDFNGKLRLYDTSTEALVIGDTTGNTRGYRAIDISATRTGATYVASGAGALLLGNGIASGGASTSIAGGFATAGNSVAIRGTASGIDSITIGPNSTASNNSAIAIGQFANAPGSSALAILGTASGSGSTAVGQQATASGNASFALGFFSTASGSGTIALGPGVQSSGTNTLIMGAYFTDNSNQAICFGVGPSLTVGGNQTLLKITDSQVDFNRDIFANAANGTEMIRNGTMTNTSFWTMGTGWSIMFGTARAASVTTGRLTQVAANLLSQIIVGAKYRLTYTVSSYFSGSVRCVIGGVNLTARTADGTYIEDFTAVTGGTDVFFECVSTPATLRLDNVSLIRIVDGNINAAGDLKLTTAGSGIDIKEGTNATMGLATLVAGVAVVSTTKVTANSRIFLTRQTTAGTLGTSVDVTARTAGTSFTITSNGSILDTSTVAWIIVEPL